MNKIDKIIHYGIQKMNLNTTTDTTDSTYAYIVTFKLPGTKRSKTYQFRNINVGLVQDLSPKGYTPVALYCDTTGYTMSLSDNFETGKYTVLYKNDVNYSTDSSTTLETLDKDKIVSLIDIVKAQPKIVKQNPKAEINPHLFKIMIVGDIGTGKSEWMKRYVHNIFSLHYKCTIGVDFALKHITHEDVQYQLQLWDMSGQERFGCMTKVYYKEAAGAIIMFDVTRPSTLHAVIKWKQDIDSRYKPGIPIVMVASKIDCPNHMAEYTVENMNRICEEQGFIGWCEISSKDSINVNKPGDMLLRKLIVSSQEPVTFPEPASVSKEPSVVPM